MRYHIVHFLRSIKPFEDNAAIFSSVFANDCMTFNGEEPFIIMTTFYGFRFEIAQCKYKWWTSLLSDDCNNQGREEVRLTQKIL